MFVVSREGEHRPIIVEIASAHADVQVSTIGTDVVHMRMEEGADLLHVIVHKQVAAKLANGLSPIVGDLAAWLRDRRDPQECEPGRELEDSSECPVDD